MTEQILLTPGPLTVSDRVRAAMNRDWGSRDAAFVEMTAKLRRDLVELAGADAATTTAVPVQGSGTFAVEAMLAAFAPQEQPCLVMINGAYGHRMVDILQRLGRPVVALEGDEAAPLDPNALRAALADTPNIGALALVHCETTTGVLNPVPEIAQIARDHDLPVLLDAMSAFGALPTDMGKLGLTAVAASSNKCLQGVPGLGVVICDRAALAATKGRSPSLSLDLAGQEAGFAKSGEWRFTPPTQVVAALAEAVQELAEEGGPEARLARYTTNMTRLIAGMAGFGIKTILTPEDQAPIIITFDIPDLPGFAFQPFYDGLKDRGFVIYPGKLTKAPSFRIGCIGAVSPEDIDRFLVAAEQVLAEMAQA